VTTHAAQALLARHGVCAQQLLERHARGDWGDLAAADREANQLAIEAGSFILSAYRVDDQRVWVVREPSRQQTWLLLPQEY
jgi:hypothetical protein